MTVDRYLRMIAGAFVMLTVALGYWVSQDAGSRGQIELMDDRHEVL